MILRRLAITYGTALVVFLAVDALWLGVLARDMYKRELGPLLRTPPNLWAAAVFYPLFLTGLLVFGVRPGAADRTMLGVIGYSCLYGLYTYATYELTNLATLAKWPAKLAVIDTLWGAFLCGVTAAIVFAVERWACGE